MTTRLAHVVSLYVKRGKRSIYKSQDIVLNHAKAQSIAKNFYKKTTKHE